GQSTLGAFAHTSVETERVVTVEVRKLDDIVDENPPSRLDVMKIDVEGAELRLLRGAAGTVERYRPYILLEVSAPSLAHQGTTPEELLGYLRSHQYQLYAFDRVTGLPVPAGPGVYSENMLAARDFSPRGCRIALAG